RLPRELILMRKVGFGRASSGVIQLLDWFQRENEFLLVLERPEPCKDLLSYSRHLGHCLEEAEARSFMQQLIKIIQHCHKRHVLHGDVKAENILVELDTGKIYLLDFGCGSVLDESVGTPDIETPEWILHAGYRGVPATVWSLGVLLFDITCGELPFKTEEEIINGVLDFPANVSSDCQNLIRSCLAHCPEDRPSLKQILRHRWMQ
ncbi:PIM1 kinase, partial [Amia calva]|nr:PIM1 kinase [Amia calva]